MDYHKFSTHTGEDHTVFLQDRESWAPDKSFPLKFCCVKF